MLTMTRFWADAGGRYRVYIFGKSEEASSQVLPRFIHIDNQLNRGQEKSLRCNARNQDNDISAMMFDAGAGDENLDFCV